MNPFLNKVTAYICGGLLFIMTFPLATSGQSHLTLQDAIRTGLANHYGIRIARNEAALAEENVTPGNAGMLPRISAFGQWEKASLDAEVHTSLGTRIDRKPAAVNLVSTGVQAQWILYDGTAMFLEYDRLKSLSALASLSLRNEMEEAIHNITEAYFDMVRLQRILESCRRQLDVSRMRSAVASANFRLGAGSELEMIQAKVTFLDDSTAFTRQQTALQVAGLKLNKLLAVSLEEQLIPGDTLTLVELPPLSTIVENTLQNNTVRQNAGEIQRLRELELKLARASLLPTISLDGTYLFTENETEASLINYTKTLGPHVGISASVTLFDGLARKRKISQAGTAVENQAIILTELEQELTALITEAWHNHINLLQRIALGRERCLLAEKNITIAREGYQSGSVSALQLREAQTSLFLSQSQLTDALYQARITESLLLKISGQLVKSGQPK